jgi:hypothetical protein
MIAQDFVAADLIDENGEYDPGFDAHLPKYFFVPAGTKINVDLDSMINGMLIEYFGDSPRSIKIT